MTKKRKQKIPCCPECNSTAGWHRSVEALVSEVGAWGAYGETIEVAPLRGAPCICDSCKAEIDEDVAMRSER